LPFVDGSIDRIAAIHVLEHFYEWDAGPLLAEWRRVLKPGGLLILELPCMDKVLDYIARCLKERVPVNLAFSWWAFWGNPKHHDPLMCHKWGYTYDSVKKLVSSTGFVEPFFDRPHYHFAERDMRLVCHKGASS
jgi:ubiquinone/menaquinone biosynthesis C-methylase UbiE